MPRKPANGTPASCDAKHRPSTVLVNGAVRNECTARDVSTGYVGLKAEGHRIEFRNLMLKELP